ncbi:embigin [Parambassis ranga]|uniref:Embigin n=1 Tax=Parambassis ranga TaxID=210632 RepID=A0A6P7J354_9TELE|nr:embigin [Parambassis ranga]
MAASWKQLFFQILLLFICCGRINTETTGSTPAPLVPTTPLSTDVKSVVLTGESHTENIELLNPVNLSLECTWTGNPIKLPNITGFWRKDGNEIQNSHLTVQLENNQYNIKQVFSIVSEKDLGNYSCVFGNEVKVDFILAAPQITEVRDKPIVSYVGDFVVIECKMDKTKPMPSTWNWYRDNGTEKVQIMAAAEPGRYEIKNNEWETKLRVHNLTEADRGLYYCGAVYAIGTTMGQVKLKVITFLEPLKPFVTIVGEVIILVAAILLYERSQSKQTDRAAFPGRVENADENSTQTQSEDKGNEDSSSMRQRKI